VHRWNASEPQRSGQFGQDLLLVGDDAIELFLIAEQSVQLLLIRFDPFLIGENRSLILQDFLLIRDGRIGHPDAPLSKERLR
jgi:hypothetical protein